jgi:hypothetical protein
MAAPQAGPISIYSHPCPANCGQFLHRGGRRLGWLSSNTVTAISVTVCVVSENPSRQCGMGREMPGLNA